MKIHFVVHEAFEGPGYFDDWAKAHGYDHAYTRLYLGEELPTSLNEVDCLVVLGGPQNPSTTRQECSYFDSLSEQALIRAAADQNKIVIGVCLGAQLIGEALGSSFERSPHREIGFYPIKLSPDGEQDPFLDDFERTEVVGHWHNDMPGLTENAAVLASSQGCPRQIVRYAKFVYGFQCHLELTGDQLESLIAHSEAQFEERSDRTFVQSQSEIIRADKTRMHGLLASFLNKIVDAYQRMEYKGVCI